MAHAASMNESGLWTKVRGAINEHPRARGVKSYDPIILGLDVVALAACAIVAASIPARRATRVDPIVRWYE